MVQSLVNSCKAIYREIDKVKPLLKDSKPLLILCHGTVL